MVSSAGKEECFRLGGFKPYRAVVWDHAVYVEALYHPGHVGDEGDSPAAVYLALHCFVNFGDVYGEQDWGGG